MKQFFFNQIIIFIIICRKKQKPIKSGENIEVNHQHHATINKDNISQPMTYSRICLDSDMAVMNATNNFRTNNSNLVTFSAPNNGNGSSGGGGSLMMKTQPLYANLPMTKNDANIIHVPVSQNIVVNRPLPAIIQKGQHHHPTSPLPPLPPSQQQQHYNNINNNTTKNL